MVSSIYSSITASRIFLIVSGALPPTAAVMVRLGIVESEDAFYGTLYGKWREYLYRIRSGQQLMEVLGRDFSSPRRWLPMTPLCRIWGSG